jgi:hypothetical protein
MSCLLYFCEWVSQTFLYLPSKAMYLKGPSFGAVGGWDGMHESMICSTLTKTDERLWAANKMDCSALIDFRFRSFFVIVTTAVYFAALYNMVSYAALFAMLWLYRKAVRCTALVQLPAR